MLITGAGRRQDGTYCSFERRSQLPSRHRCILNPTRPKPCLPARSQGTLPLRHRRCEEKEGFSYLIISLVIEAGVPISSSLLSFRLGVLLLSLAFILAFVALGLLVHQVPVLHTHLVQLVMKPLFDGQLGAFLQVSVIVDETGECDVMHKRDEALVPVCCLICTIFHTTLPETLNVMRSTHAGCRTIS